MTVWEVAVTEQFRRPAEWEAVVKKWSRKLATRKAAAVKQVWRSTIWDRVRRWSFMFTGLESGQCWSALVGECGGAGRAGWALTSHQQRQTAGQTPQGPLQQEETAVWRTTDGSTDSSTLPAEVNRGMKTADSCMNSSEPAAETDGGEVLFITSCSRSTRRTVFVTHRCQLFCGKAGSRL